MFRIFVVKVVNHIKLCTIHVELMLPFFVLSIYSSNNNNNNNNINTNVIDDTNKQ